MRWCAAFSRAARALPGTRVSMEAQLVWDQLFGSQWLHGQQERWLQRLEALPPATQPWLQALQQRALNALGKNEARTGRACIAKLLAGLGGTAILAIAVTIRARSGARAFEVPPVDEGVQIRLKMAELSDRLEHIKQPLARCRDASSLTPERHRGAGEPRTKPPKAKPQAPKKKKGSKQKQRPPRPGSQR